MPFPGDMEASSKGMPIEFLTNPQKLYETLWAMKRVENIQFQIVQATSPQASVIDPVSSPDNMLVPLPFKFGQPVTDVAAYATGTAGVGYTASQVQALMDQVAALTTTVNALLYQLRLASLNPS